MNFDQKIAQAVRQAVKDAFDLDAEENVLTIDTPKDPKLGDYASSAAMKLARALHQAPLAIAEALAPRLQELLPEAESVTVAKPGFLNFRMKKDAFTAVINQVLSAGDDYGKNLSGKGRKALVEWVSANPTGDLHCGHARNAAWGDAICRLMEASGWEVLCERRRQPDRHAGQESGGPVLRVLWPERF